MCTGHLLELLVWHQISRLPGSRVAHHQLARPAHQLLQQVPQGCLRKQECCGRGVAVDQRAWPQSQEQQWQRRLGEQEHGQQRMM